MRTFRVNRYDRRTFARSIGELVTLTYVIDDIVYLAPFDSSDEVVPSGAVAGTFEDPVIIDDPDHSPAIVLAVHPLHVKHSPGTNRSMLVMCEGKLGYASEDWMDPV